MDDDYSFDKLFGTDANVVDSAFNDVKPLLPRAPSVVESRLNRELAYNKTSIDVSKWNRLVQHNREARSARFGYTQKERLSTASMVSKFEPANDMEREIAKLYQDQDSSNSKNFEDNIVERENSAVVGNDANDSNELDREVAEKELEKRRSELSKLRHLLFCAELKNKRLSKIKSKRSKLMARRERQKIAKAKEALDSLSAGAGAGVSDSASGTKALVSRYLDAAKNGGGGGGANGGIDRDYDAEDGGEGCEDERAVKRRIEERMSLRHKNTSKWAKQTLRVQRETGGGGKAGKNMRAMLKEQMQKGEELRRKIGQNAGTDSGSDSDSDSSDDGDSDNDSGGDGGGDGKRRALMAKAAKLVESFDSDNSSSNSSSDEGDEKKKRRRRKVGGVMSMAFMRRAAAEEKERVKSDATRLLKEMEEEENYSTNSSSANNSASDSDSDEVGSGDGDEEEEEEEEGGGGVGGGSLVSRSDGPIAVFGDSEFVGRDSNNDKGTDKPSDKEGKAKAKAKNAAIAATATANTAMDTSAVAYSAKPLVPNNKSSRSSSSNRGETKTATATASVKARAKAVRFEDGGSGEGVVGRAAAADIAAADASTGDQFTDHLLALNNNNNNNNDGGSNGAGSGAVEGVGVGDDGGLSLAEFAKDKSRLALLEERERLTSIKKYHQMLGLPLPQHIHNALASLSNSGSGSGTHSGGGGGTGVEGWGSWVGDGVQEAKLSRRRAREERARQQHQLQAQQRRFHPDGTKKTKRGKKRKNNSSNNSSSSSTTKKGKDKSKDKGSKGNKGDKGKSTSTSTSMNVNAVAPLGCTALPRGGAGQVAKAGVRLGSTRKKTRVIDPVNGGYSKAREDDSDDELFGFRDRAKRRRIDAVLPTVIISERTIKRANRLRVSELPFPYTSVDQYEKTLALPIGQEWNAFDGHRTLTRPSVAVRKGASIAPIKADKKVKERAKKLTMMQEEKKQHANERGQKRKARGKFKP